MNILEKIEKYLSEEGVITADIATNDAQGSVDIINKDQCPDGFIWDKKKKVCIKKDNT